jgi:hypothetical protein
MEIFFSKKSKWQKNSTWRNFEKINKKIKMAAETMTATKAFLFFT